MSHVFHLDLQTFIVLAGLIVFLGVLVYAKVPGMITAALDARAEAISKELEDARRLREEAQETLATYQRRQREAEAEAAAIVDQAKRDAARLAESMREEFALRLARREAMTERKIAQAEADALAAVRNHAADLAAEAARSLLATQLDQAALDATVDDSIKDLERAFSRSS